MADMARAHINFRTGAALVLLAVLVVLFASLGNWQLDRAAQRDAIHAQIQHAAQLPAVSLDAQTDESDLVAWRPAQAQGQWLHQYTVLLHNRNYQSRPGYWVVTPLQLAKNGPAVVILRGWLARDDVIRQTDRGAAQLDPALGHWLARPDSSQTIAVTGQLLSHVPRLFELWSWSRPDTAQLPEPLQDTRQNLPTMQNLDLADYERATGLSLLPVVLAANESEPAMVQDWPQPSSDSDTNRGYALQWFLFCVIAAGAWLFIAWRVVKRFTTKG